MAFIHKSRYLFIDFVPTQLQKYGIKYTWTISVFFQKERIPSSFLQKLA